MLLNSDSPAAIAKSIGIGVMGFADAFVNLQPNYLILLGDRFEVFAAASAAHTMGIPIVHLHGGEVTEGSIDDGYRHGITKLSSLHFTATTEYRNRVIQMGQWPKSVHVVGALGLDAIKNVMPVSQPALEDFLGISLSGDSLLVTLHPETHGAEPAEDQVTGMLDALARVDASLIFTMPNADSGGRKIWSFIESFVAENRSRACLHRSLGQDRYLSLLSRVSAVVGNSSSGIIEAPSFGIGTVNIGGRQAGRDLRAARHPAGARQHAHAAPADRTGPGPRAGAHRAQDPGRGGAADRARERGGAGRRAAGSRERDRGGVRGEPAGGAGRRQTRASLRRASRHGRLHAERAGRERGAPANPILLRSSPQPPAGSASSARIFASVFA